MSETDQNPSRVRQLTHVINGRLVEGTSEPALRRRLVAWLELDRLTVSLPAGTLAAGKPGIF